MNGAVLNINLNAVKNNFNRLQNFSDKIVETGAVVKANAYGLGVNPIAKHLFDCKVRTFFVATVNEAVELRALIPAEAKIYYLNGYSKNDHQAVNEFNIMPVLSSIDQIESFKRLSKKSAALQIDVGMSRLGITTSEISIAKEMCESIDLNLIIGHLSSADNKFDKANLSQLNIFSKLSKYFPNVTKSLAATGGIILGNKYHFNLTRPGIGIFGGKPLVKAENVVTLDLPVLQVKDIKKNDGVGYNHTYIAERPKKIAIVGSGYADGLFRQLSNKGILYAGETPCPILGRISMDLITVDITNIAYKPSTLSVLGPFQTIDDLAAQSSTIGYEILTSLGSRYKRVYHR
tara:strand:- start:513 stop:1553 length:1041 start_codon:yes stop_codon:yes gene_type:complete